MSNAETEAPSRPSTITSYDLLKTFAVIIMIIDHIGYYFFPDDEWWRAIGRVGFPIWFYLVGHASGRNISLKLLGGAVILLGMNAITGLALFPLNALFTIIALRVCIDHVMKPSKKVPALLWPILMVMTVLILPTNFAFEYGTQAFLFAMFGYMVRNREALLFTRNDLQFFMISIAAIFLAFQFFAFGFSAWQFGLMAFGVMAVCITLQDFRAKSYPSLDNMPAALKQLFRVCGNYTLEIYVAHLVLFKIIAVAYGLAGTHFLVIKLVD